MQWSTIIITYLILREKLALNDVRMMKIALGGGKFVFWEFGKMKENVVVKWLKSRCVAWVNSRSSRCHAGVKLSFQFRESNFLFICPPIIFIIILSLSFSFFIIALAVFPTVFSLSRSRCSFFNFHSFAAVRYVCWFIFFLFLFLFHF